MANLENNSLDTRTFGQFCESLTKRQWVELQGELAQKLKRSLQCIYNWKRGYRVPSSASERARIAEHINRKFNITTRHWFLFPDPEL